MGRFSKNDGFAAKNSRLNISTLSSELKLYQGEVLQYKPGASDLRCVRGSGWIWL